MSTLNPTHGKKVTTDPAGQQNVIREAVGAITSDSLAAESVRAGGGFSENRGAAPLAVKGANSTFNTTDTHAARELAPAERGSDRPGPEALEPLQAGRDAYGGKARTETEHEQRQQDEHRRPDDADKEAAAAKEHGEGQGKARRGGGSGGNDGGQQQQRQGQDKSTTTTTTGGSDNEGERDTRSSGGDAGGHGKNKQSGSSTREGGGEEGAGTSTARAEGASQDKQQAQHAADRATSYGSSQVVQGGAPGGEAGVAPSYVKHDVTERAKPGGPKGARLTEGGELDRAAKNDDDEEDAPNASFNNEIGTENDPARLAEQKMLLGRSALDAQPQAGRRVGDGGATDGGQYQALSADEPA